MCVTKWERRHVVTHALFDHWNLVPAALLGLAPVFMAWWLVWMGLLLYVLVVGVRAASPSFRREVMADASSVRSCLPDGARLCEPKLAGTVAAIRKARGRAVRALVAAPPEVSGYVGSLLPTVVDLEHRASGLVRQADELDRFLADEDLERLQKERERLGLRACEVLDEPSRADLVAAQTARAGQLAAVDELRDVRDRLGASLERLLALLEEVPSRVARLAALDLRAKHDLPAQLTGELSRIEGTLRSTERLFAELE